MSELRDALTRQMLRALEQTWKGLDAAGEVRDPAHNLSIVRGGVESFIRGEFEMPFDAVSLGLSLLTLAREDIIARGGVVPLPRAEPS